MRVCHPLLLIVALIGPWSLRATADGLVYRLPPDGTWAQFVIEGTVVDCDQQDQEPSLNVTGSLTICCVGTQQVDGRLCRWMEIVARGERDGHSFQEIVKLLIPEEEIGQGKNPLEHVLDAWHMHSAVDKGRPRRLSEQQRSAVGYGQRVRAILHPPFQNARQAGAQVVECKLGKVDCEMVTAEEHEKQVGSDIEYGSSYVIYLHDHAPFGVAAWQATNQIHRGGELVGARKLKMVLTDVGQDAKSQIAHAE